jgi:hypothetical protein
MVGTWPKEISGMNFRSGAVPRAHSSTISLTQVFGIDFYRLMIADERLHAVGAAQGSYQSSVVKSMAWPLRRAAII